MDGAHARASSLGQDSRFHGKDRHGHSRVCSVRVDRNLSLSGLCWDLARCAGRHVLPSSLLCILMKAYRYKRSKSPFSLRVRRRTRSELRAAAGETLWRRARRGPLSGSPGTRTPVASVCGTQRDGCGVELDGPCARRLSFVALTCGGARGRDGRGCPEHPSQPQDSPLRPPGEPLTILSWWPTSRAAFQEKPCLGPSLAPFLELPAPIPSLLVPSPPFPGVDPKNTPPTLFLHVNSIWASASPGTHPATALLYFVLHAWTRAGETVF